jgi:hypothetical protein
MSLTKRKSEAELLEKLAEAVSSTVEKTLQKRERIPHILRTGCAPLARLVRKKLTNRRLWLHQIEPLLANARLEEIIEREMKRRERKIVDSAQLALPGFEDLPRRIRVGNASVPMAQVTVGQLLQAAARYETSAAQSNSKARELIRLADVLREQPPDLNVREALARAEAGDAKTRKASK